MKTEVYSWRVSADLKNDLEREARRRKTSVAAVITLATKELLKRCATDENYEAEQRRLHAEARKCIGAYAGDDPTRSQRVSELVRGKLQRKYGR